MYARLPKFEIISYFLLCIFVMWYFFLHVYLGGNVFVQYLGSDESIVPGWPILNRLQDTSDEEWMTWRFYMVIVLPWLIAHLMFSFFCRYFFIRALSISNSVISLLFITYYININVALLFLLYTLVFYITILMKSKLLVWPVGIVMLLCNAYDLFDVRESLDSRISLMAEISFSWFILKSIDFTMSELKRDSMYTTLLDFISYSLYLPTFFFGPFVPYENFQRGMYKSAASLMNLENFKRFFVDVLRYLLWALVIEVSSHYIYSTALHYHLNSIIFRNLWTLNGIGFCLAQFFYLKYLVFYGLSGCIAKLEGYDAPAPPKCVNRIHLYSKMWRYFDRGYYLFTFNCIYRPICQTPSCSRSRKFFASIVSFGFVFLWHGLTYTIFYWSLFNFIGISLEAIGKHLCSTPLYTRFITFCGTPQNVRRFSCILTSPLWILAVISNYFFFGGHEYGFKCFKQFFTGDLQLILFTFLVAYAMCQISVEVENLEFFKRRKTNENITSKAD